MFPVCSPASYRLWPRRARVLAVLLVAALGGCQEKRRPAEDLSVIATVNGEVVTRTDFERALSSDVFLAEGAAGPSSDQAEPVKRAVLETLLARRLLLQAARQYNITVTPEEVDRDVLRISGDYPAERFNEALAQGQLTMAEFKQRTAALLTIEKLLAAHVYARVAVTEDELHAYFDEHEQDFQVPERVRAAQLVVKDLDEARRLQGQLRAGKKFSELARKYSLSADAKVGGDLGFFSRGQMPPQFEEVVFRMGVNQVSDVVATDYGFHLFKVLEKRPAQKRSFADVRREVEEQLLKGRRLEAQNEFLKSLRDKADIQVNEPAVLAAMAKPSRSLELEP